jgi:hypothetical protein
MGQCTKRLCSLLRPHSLPFPISCKFFPLFLCLLVPGWIVLFGFIPWLFSFKFQFLVSSVACFVHYFLHDHSIFFATLLANFLFEFRVFAFTMKWKYLYLTIQYRCGFWNMICCRYVSAFWRNLVTSIFCVEASTLKMLIVGSSKMLVPTCRASYLRIP